MLQLDWLILYAARHSAARVAWAQVVVRTTTVTVATLPVILLALMGFRYFDAPLFVLLHRVGYGRACGVVVRGVQPRYVAYRLSNS